MCLTAPCYGYCWDILSSLLQLEEATDYDIRSKIRKAIRELKKQTGQDVGRKKVGSASYRRPGFQAPKTMTIPNSVTGNVTPDRVNMETHQFEKGGNVAIGFMGLQTTQPPRGYAQKSKGTTSSSAKRTTSTSSRGSVSSSITPEPRVWEGS